MSEPVDSVAINPIGIYQHVGANSVCFKKFPKRFIRYHAVLNSFTGDSILYSRVEYDCYPYYNYLCIRSY